jgi:hypothetical protein
LTSERGSISGTFTNSTNPMPRSWFVSGTVLALACAFVMALLLRMRRHSSSTAGMGSSSSSNPYSILGLPTDANGQAITRAYRVLAKKWHPDRNGGDKAAEQVFMTVAHAYDVLNDPEKREVFDRLGEAGLERLLDGDPSVQKDWEPPNNGRDQAWLDATITTGFGMLSSGLIASQQIAAPIYFSFAEMLGIDARMPSLRITASEGDTGVVLASGGQASEGVTFKFTLSGKSFDFELPDVTHTGCDKAKFLGMKTTFYLQCGHVPGAVLSVQVAADVFTVTGREGTNTASEKFVLSMR